MHLHAPSCRRVVLVACVSVSCVAIASLGRTASAAIVFPVSGTSAVGNPVSFKASFTIAGGTLTLQLDNTSPVDSADPADVLSSFYFDILSGTNRPTLTYTSGSGFLYLVRSGTIDLPYVYTPQTYTQASGTASNIRALNNGDNSWQLRSLSTASPPNLGFGVGTVGNNTFSPNGFTPQIVGQGNTMLNFAIYKGGDIEPIGLLDGRYLVRNTATFTFTGLGGYSEANIVDKVVFGLGTAPDSSFTVSLPEPPAGLLLVTAVAAMLAGSFRRRSGRTAVTVGPRPAEDDPPHVRGRAAPRVSASDVG